MTISDANRLFTELTRRETASDAERLSRQEALLSRFGTQIAPQSVEYALNRIALILWAGTAIMALSGLLAVLP